MTPEIRTSNFDVRTSLYIYIVIVGNFVNPNSVIDYPGIPEMEFWGPGFHQISGPGIRTSWYGISTPFLDPEFHDFRDFVKGLAEGVRCPKYPENPENRGPDPRKPLFSGV